MDPYKKTRAYLKIDDLLQSQAPDLPLPQDELRQLFIVVDQDQMSRFDQGPSRLKSLLGKLSRPATGYYQKSYVADLRKSHNAFLAAPSSNPQFSGASPYTALKNHLEKSKENVDSI